LCFLELLGSVGLLSTSIIGILISLTETHTPQQLEVQCCPNLSKGMKFLGQSLIYCKSTYQWKKYASMEHLWSKMAMQNTWSNLCCWIKLPRNNHHWKKEKKLVILDQW
jgi:hypothetical protein